VRLKLTTKGKSMTLNKKIWLIISIVIVIIVIVVAMYVLQGPKPDTPTGSPTPISEGQ